VNRPQRHLTLAALAALAIGCHLWNLRWDYTKWEPYFGPVLPGQPAGRFATVQWSTEPEIPGFFHGWGPSTGNDSGHDYLFSDWRRWGVQMWQQYELAGRPLPWEDYLRTNSRATHFLGLWSTGSEEDAWLWGIFAPLGAIGFGAYLILGWRQPRSAAQQGAAADDRPKAGDRG